MEMASVITTATLEAKILYSGRLSITCKDIFSDVSGKNFASLAHFLRKLLEDMHDQIKE